MNLYADCGAPLKAASDRTEAFSTIIQFSTEDEPTNFAEIWVSEEEIEFYQDETTVEQYKFVLAYAEEAQNAIIQYLVECNQDQDERNYLSKTAHW